uniref:Uncharacterized protein n=1 Tax=Cacopsylla melanoneura TaxID=428564 RepID=A0A8D8TXI5_9HEMI
MGNPDYNIAATVHSLNNGRQGSSTRVPFQQSTTWTAKMQENGTNTSSPWKFGSWMIPAQHFPILIAILIGVLIIMLFILALILWRCCISPHYKEDYGVKMPGDDEGPHLEPQPNHVVSMLPNHSAVFLDPKSGQLLICANRVLNPRPGDLISSHWLCTNAVPRSWSAPIHEAQSLPADMDGSRTRGPPNSASINENCPEPHISEFNPQVSSSIALHEVISPGGRSSRSGGEGGGGGGTLDGGGGFEVSELKCRSLPSTMRPKKSAIASSVVPSGSTADNSSELYAKVNFSKKKRNRMRNNEAAIIALSKSRSQFFHHHKDTDSLVDNEAVIVYDERTAL